jgi:hypothetical protein
MGDPDDRPGYLYKKILPLPRIKENWQENHSTMD